MKKNKVFFQFVILTIVCMMLTGNFTFVFAEDSEESVVTLRDVATEITKDNVRAIELNKNDYQTDAKKIQTHSEKDSVTKIKADDENPSRYVEYKNALVQNNKSINVKLEAKVVSGQGTIAFVLKDNEYGYDRLLDVGGDGCEIDVTVSFTDQNGNPYGYTGLYGLADMDYGDYKFDVSKKMYFVDAKNNVPGNNTKFADFLIAKEDGLYSSDPNYNTGYFEGMVYVYLEEVDSFTVKLFVHGDYLAFPYLYTLNWQIKYDPNSSTIEGEVKNTMPNQDVISGDNNLNENLYKAVGYEFKGWSEKEGKQQEIDYEDKDILTLGKKDLGEELIVKTLYAQWEPIKYQLAYNPNHENVDEETTMENEPEVTIGKNKTKENEFKNVGYKFLGWSNEPGKQTPVYKNGEDVPVTATDVGDHSANDVVKTLYAQWETIKYEILYNPNDDVVSPAKGTMETQTFDVETNKDDEKWNSSDPWSYSREGYDFEGYKIDNKGNTLTNPEDFKDYFLKEGNEKVELFAQWKPWEYYIEYDGNGASNKDAMQKETFNYFADSMMSKDNAFKRSGYRFTGFKVTVDGSTKIIRSPQDFKDVLLSMDPYSSIVLVAQWDKIPDGYKAPVTGIE